MREKKLNLTIYSKKNNFKESAFRGPVAPKEIQSHRKDAPLCNAWTQPIQYLIIIKTFFSSLEKFVIEKEEERNISHLTAGKRAKVEASRQNPEPLKRNHTHIMMC